MNEEKCDRELSSYQETQIAEEYKHLSFTVVLIRPENASNIGSIARLIENFNFKKLVVFNPLESRENISSYKTKGFAMHGKDILKNALIIEIDDQVNHITELRNFLQKFDLIIATTAKGRRDSNIRRLAIFPEDLSIPSSVNPLNIAVLFGKESRGLTNKEISLADIILRIPTGENYSSLNLSHACGIILYEIFKKINIVNIGRGKHPVLLADRKDRQILLKIIQNIIVKLKIRAYKKENLKFAFRNIFERVFMSKKELSLMTGLFSKVNNILESIDLYEE